MPGDGSSQEQPRTFLHLVEKARTLDAKLVQQFRDARDYEALELHVLKHLMGVK